jgi:Tol biopolymer transport system component
LGLDWALDGRIFYGASRNGNIDVWRINADGSDLKQLTSNAETDFSPVAAGGEIVIFLSARSGQTNLWRMSTDGASPKQLTNGFDIASLSVPQDGKWIYFSGKFDERQNNSLWKTSVEGDAPVQITDKQISHPKISPDGKFVAGYFPEASAVNSLALKLTVFSAENGEIVKQFVEDFSPTQLGAIAWTFDGNALVYAKPTLEGNKLKMQSLSETEPRFLLQQTERVFKFALSKNSSKFVCERGVLINDAYLIREASPK